MKSLVPSVVAILFAALLPTASAEEKNGLQVTVAKRTLNRADRRDSFYYTRYDRTQGLKLTIRNTSFKPMPEGEVNWTLLVKKATYVDMTEKYVGTEKLKALRPSESVEIMVGAVPIQGYRYERDYKDEMEHDIAISHAGKETIRMTSMQGFSALSKRARLIQTPDEEEDEQPGPARKKPAANDGGGTVKPEAVKPAERTRPPETRPSTPPPAETTPPRTKPAEPAPAATPTQPKPSDTPPTEKKEGDFDFFNLNKKKAPEGK